MSNNLVGLEDLWREYTSQKPKEVYGLNNATTQYYERWCWRKILGIFELSGIPEIWDTDYLLEKLVKEGYFAVTDTDVGVIPLECGLSGINFYNKPTTCVFTNPVLGSFDREIGISAELVFLQYDYKGLRDLVKRISVLLAMCDSAISVNLMNSKVTFIAMAGSKQQAETMRKMYDDISAGKPAVFVRGDVVNEESFYFNHVKENFIADQVQELKRSIINEFLTALGMVYVDKSERMTDTEIVTYFDEIADSVQHWKENLKECCQRVNNMFGLNISITIKTGRENKTDEPTERDRLSAESEY